MMHISPNMKVERILEIQLKEMDLNLKVVASFKLPEDTIINYTVLSKAVGVDYVNNPQWLERESDAMILALWFWNKSNFE